MFLFIESLKSHVEQLVTPSHLAKFAVANQTTDFLLGKQRNLNVLVIPHNVHSSPAHP